MITFIADARHFIETFTALILRSPLQLYNSAFIFSPTESKIRQLFWKEVPVWIKRYPNVPKDWETDHGELVHQGDDNRFSQLPTAILFSPNGEILANTWGRQIDLWDVESRILLGTIGHGTPLQNTLEFSPNGDLLATVSIKDHVVMLWDPETRELRASLTGH